MNVVLIKNNNNLFLTAFTSSVNYKLWRTIVYSEISPFLLNAAHGNNFQLFNLTDLN